MAASLLCTRVFACSSAKASRVSRTLCVDALTMPNEPMLYWLI